MYYIVYLLYYMPCVMPFTYDGEAGQAIEELVG